MRRIGRWTLGMVLVAAASPPMPAAATTMFPQQFTCPIGGEAFEDYVIGSYTSFGQRPDGRDYGTLPVPPIVECPGNGFLLFEEEFAPEEIALLSPLVASAEYQAMRGSETPYYRAWWLMRALGRAPEQLASALLVASWETDDDPVRKARYQRAFVEAAGSIAPASDGWFTYNLRAANALRELARFDEAAERLAVVERSDAWPEDEEEREGARFLLDGLRMLVAERNPHPEPANLIPPMIAAERCADLAASLSAAERKACAEPAYQEAVAQRHRDLEEEAVASMLLAENAAFDGAASAADEADAAANIEAAAEAFAPPTDD